MPMSAVYCGTTLLGVTEQLIGEPWLHAKGFVYCGNIGSMTLKSNCTHEVYLPGSCLRWGTRPA